LRAQCFAAAALSAGGRRISATGSRRLEIGKAAHYAGKPKQSRAPSENSSGIRRQAMGGSEAAGEAIDST